MVVGAALGARVGWTLGDGVGIGTMLLMLLSLLVVTAVIFVSACFTASLARSLSFRPRLAFPLLNLDTASRSTVSAASYSVFAVSFASIARCFTW